MKALLGGGGSRRSVLTDFGPAYAASAITGLVFSATGPVAIILSAGTAGGLSSDELASWIFAVFFVNGLITIAMSWIYRQPLAFFWTIPGTVLVGPALEHLTFAEVIGAFYVTGAVVTLVGMSGLMRRAMSVVPMPIVMAMVAGVFLRFGLDLVRTISMDPALGVPMVGAFLLLSAVPMLGRRLPPLIGALVVGAIVIGVTGRFDGSALGELHVIRPVVQVPSWSATALLELVIPLAITVLVVQNGQGFAVLASAGHRPPVDACTIMSGLGSLAAAVTGGISSCVTGPTNALLTSVGERSRHYTSAICLGILAVLFGLMAPAVTKLMLATPREYVMLLAGLALLRVLQTAFVTSFGQRFSLGALVCFLVSVADVSLLNIGGAFWGLVAGILVSAVLEIDDFRTIVTPRQ